MNFTSSKAKSGMSKQFLHKINITNKTFANDEYGGVVEASQESKNVWCNASYVETVDASTKNYKQKRQTFKFLILKSSCSVNYSSVIQYQGSDFRIENIIIEQNADGREAANNANYIVIIASCPCI